MRLPVVILCSLSILSVPACDSSDEVDDKFKVEKKFIPLSERKQKSDATPEELAELRKKAGFKSQEEQAAENAAMFEKGAREYVKTRMQGYRDFVADVRKDCDTLEKEAAAWAASRDPERAFEKFKTSYDKRAMALDKTYMTLTGNMSEGGDTTAKLGKAFRAWEGVKSELGPEITNNERFAPAVQEIRTLLEPVDALLDDIDKDDTLVVNKFYKADDDESK